MMNRIYPISLVTLLGAAAAAPTAHAQSAAQNPWFGPHDHRGSFYTLTNSPTQVQRARAVVTDPLMRVIVLQDYESGAGDQDCALQRHDENAILPDMTFGYIGQGDLGLEATVPIAFDLGGTKTDTCTDVELAGTKLVVGGTAATTSGTTGVIAQVTHNGALDAAFSGDGKYDLRPLGFAGSTSIADLATLSDGSIVACGTVRIGTDEDMLIVKLTKLGQLDPGFGGGDGYTIVSFDNLGVAPAACSALVVQPDGKLVAAGYYKPPADPADWRFAATRLTAAGDLDPTFGEMAGWTRIDVDAAVADAEDFASGAVYDAALSRLYLVGTSRDPAAAARAKGVVIALDAAGALDTAFAGDGIKDFRFSDAENTRGAGDTTLRRAFMSGTNVYVVGDHVNVGAANTAAYGTRDVGVAAFMRNGGFQVGHDGDGVSYSSFGLTAYQDFEAHASWLPAYRLKLNEELGDIDWRDGRLTIAFSANRFPSWAPETASYGNYAPALAQLRLNESGVSGEDFDGIPAPADWSELAPEITISNLVYGRYCSVVNATTGDWDYATGTASADPCVGLQVANPGAAVVRAGMYSLNGNNQVALDCDGMDRAAAWKAPGDDAMALLATVHADKLRCEMTVTPSSFPIFYAPTDTSGPTRASLFNHVWPVQSHPTDTTVNVTSFGGTPVAGHTSAHRVDRFGNQWCDGTAGGDPNDSPMYGGDIDEPMFDWTLPLGRSLESVAPGIVLQAAPRYLIHVSSRDYADPWQREVVIGHRAGRGTDSAYDELFYTYYAHMMRTQVRRGELVDQNTLVGLVGHSGAAGNDHLHFHAGKVNNLTWSEREDYGFDRRAYGDNAAWNTAIDPYGWHGDGPDPIGYLWRGQGSFSLELWRAGEAPPTLTVP
jgi:uncharacterized delta-60 repeat protein